MIKNADFKNTVINIFFKDGSEVKGKDIPSETIHSGGNILYYWEGDRLIAIPINQVYYFCFCEPEVDNAEK